MDDTVSALLGNKAAYVCLCGLNSLLDYSDDPVVMK